MRILGSTPRHWTPGGEPAYVIWWMGDEWQEYTTPLGFDALPLAQQAGDFGPYLCRCPGGPLGPYIEVRLGWHHGHGRVLVDSYAETRREIRRWTGVRFAEFEDLRSAVEYARGEVRLLHKWMNSEGTLPLPHVRTLGVPVPTKSPAELRAELARREARNFRFADLAGTGSKAGIARRRAEAEWNGERMALIRRELQAVSP